VAKRRRSKGTTDADLSQALRQAILQAVRDRAPTLDQLAFESGVQKFRILRFAMDGKDIRLSTASVLASCLGLKLRQIRSAARKPAKKPTPKRPRGNKG
jgi:hypothetical protein